MFPPRFSADRWWVPVELPAALHVDGRGVTRTSWSPGYVLEVAHTGVTLLMLDEAQKLVRRTLSMAELATPTQLFEGYIAFLGAPSGVVSGVHVEVAQYEGLGYLLAPRESARWYSIQAEDRWRSEDPYRYVELAYSPSGTPSW